MSEQRPGSRVLGTLSAENGTATVRMEDRYATTIEDLWSALTEPERLARWIAKVDGDLRLGGTFRAEFTSGWEGSGRVDVCDPPRRLVVTTRQDGDATDCVITASLTPAGDETILVVEERGMPLEQIAGYGAGWQVHLEDLAAHVAGRERCDIEARWNELQPIYDDLASGDD